MADSPLPPTADAPAWQNITGWTSRFVNVSKIAPTLEDLVWAGPRMVKKLGSYIPFQDAFEGAGAHAIFNASDAPAASAAGFSMSASAAAQQTAAAASPVVAAASSSAFSMEGAKGLGSVFSYATSKWALSCIAMAVVLNRTYIFAATRRRLRLTWPVRLLIRALPILLFLFQAKWLLQSMQCQTSPDFAELRWGDSSKSSDLLFTHPGGFLHKLSSTLLLGATDEASCLAVRMIPDETMESTQNLRGSLSRLWPLFGTFCLSQFIETISCAVQGRPVAAETGMTLFEHSLAFAEADAAISNQLSWTTFAVNQAADSGSTSGSAIAISRSMVLRRVNTPPEVLLVAFLSVMSHLTSHILGVFNLQARFRLLNTGFWGLGFMTSIVWSAVTFSLDDPGAQGLLRYPTVCIIGFVPHVLVLCGILVCLFIYGLALLLATLSHRGGNLTFSQRLSIAHGNMQANISLSDIRVTREMDFYTALLRTGFGAITMASEAVYLNEDRDVNLKLTTWLEDERFRELEELRMQWIGANASDARLDSIGTVGLIPVKDGQASANSGYARERAAQKLSKTRAGERRLRDGVGAADRSGRWLLSLDFLVNTWRLVFRAWAAGVIRVLGKLGIRPPRMLLWVIRRPKQAGENRANRPEQSQASSSNVQVSGRDGVRIPETEAVDVEAEFRRSRSTRGLVPQSEDDLDANLYNWWVKGHHWGTTDSSGDYRPAPEELDDDTTSVISFATDSDVEEDAWESDDDGQRTPTQRSPIVSRETSPQPDIALPMSDLARLLAPSNPEEKEEAHALAAHLRSSGIMTRSQYRNLQHWQRTEILNPARSGANMRAPPVRLTPEEEVELLEQLILSRRRQGHTRANERGTGTAWADGAAGLGDDGPQCVVCHSSPRTVIVWPCRCLSLCDDCRVSLAMNNFDKCVCCRREVISFSRIFVP
ncbi:hypothetical protein B0T11DRAFT_289086 [Plectosphaerella cucumerina]|uniref:Uncharacterized protein n=1 Tax=Plectosphaerella cucumerina TaxID=40658 RepID=A0A8K0T7G4_9PEZI|nr:hypothetical protein B0T11DRAFT_289086 [Plectosphaerella cucumerina]